MANNYKAEYEFFPSESKHEGDLHVYRGAGAMSGLSDDNLSAIELRQHPYLREQYDICLSFDTPTDKRDSRIETVKGLLEGNAGVTDIEVKSHGNASGFSITIEKMKQEDLMRIAVALTQDAPKGKSDSYYPVMGQPVAEQVIANELNRLQLTPIAAGLVKIEKTEMDATRANDLGLQKSVGYIDVDFSSYPLTPVSFMREEANFAELSGEKTMYMSTDITARDGQGKRVAEALQDAGIKVTRSEFTPFVKAQAPADVVAEALQQAKLLSPVITEAVKNAAEAVHPGQREVNAGIDAEFISRVRKPAASAAPA